jgi:hypothetical protein
MLVLTSKRIDIQLPHAPREVFTRIRVYAKMLATRILKALMRQGLCAVVLTFHKSVGKGGSNGFEDQCLFSRAFGSRGFSCRVC